MPHSATKSYYNSLKSAEPANWFKGVLDRRYVANHMLNCPLKTPRLLLNFHEFVCLTEDSTDLWYPSYRENRKSRKSQLHGVRPRRQKHRMFKGIFKPKVIGFWKRRPTRVFACIFVRNCCEAHEVMWLNSGHPVLWRSRHRILAGIYTSQHWLE